MQHVAFGDAVGGLNGTAAVLTALWHKQRTGKGQFVDLSQVECLFPLAAPGILHQSVHGQTPQRFGNAHPNYAPHGVYPCHGDDAWAVIQVTEETQWHQLKAIIPTLSEFSDLDERLAKREAIDACIGAWTQQRTASEVMQTLQAAGVTAAKLNNGQELLDEPHLKDRAYLQWLERDHVGLQPHPSAPFRTAEEPIPINSPAPTLGQHNHAILVDLLGLSADETQQLVQRGVIGTKPRMPSGKSAN